MKRTRCKAGLIAGSLVALLSVVAPTLSSADCQLEYYQAAAVSDRETESMTIAESNRAADAWEKVAASCPADISTIASDMAVLYRCLSGWKRAEALSKDKGKGAPTLELKRAAAAWDAAAALCAGEFSTVAALNSGLFRCTAEWNQAVDLETLKRVDEAATAWGKAAASCTGEESREARCNADYDHALVLWEKAVDGMAQGDLGRVADAWDKAAASCTGEKSEGASLASALLRTSL